MKQHQHCFGQQSNREWNYSGENYNKNYSSQNLNGRSGLQRNSVWHDGISLLPTRKSEQNNVITDIITQIHSTLCQILLSVMFQKFIPPIHIFTEQRQLGFVKLNGNLAINLKPTHPSLLNGKGQFPFLKAKSSHSSGNVVYPPKFEFLRN